MNHIHMTIAEIRSGKLRQVTLEAIQAAMLLKEANDRIVTVILGHHISAFAQELTHYGIDEIITVDHSELEAYNSSSYYMALSDIIDSTKPDTLIFGHTSVGRDLAPKVAAKLHAGQISDVIAIEKTDSEVSFTRPLYAGKALEKKSFAEGIKVVTIRPNNLPAADVIAGSHPVITQATYTAASDLRSVVKSVVNKASAKLDLTEAKVVVSGGRGVKSADGFDILEQLAEVLGAAVGASRGACDAGYCDYALQIGQTGKVVTPEIYIACGISGAIQHLAGMSQSRIIIAINKDPEAPIFKVADYGIVGDLFEVVPLLTEEFKKALA
jgi:electron transfer flavoprotein alpha subunit